jgi:uncharacterized repeat protein (TIGR03943 family)
MNLFDREISPGRLCRALLLLAYSFFVSWLADKGRLSGLVHPRLQPWIIASGLIALVLAFTETLRLDRRPRRPDSLSVYYSLAFAMALVAIYSGGGVAAQAAGLSSSLELSSFQSSLSKRQGAERRAEAGKLGGSIVFDDDSYWGLYNRLYDDPRAAAGKRVTIQGFVSRSAAFGKGAPHGLILVSRKLMWCCSADMALIGLPAEGPAAYSLPEGAWIEATGTLEAADLDLQGRGERKTVPLIRLSAIRVVERSASTTIFPY